MNNRNMKTLSETFLLTFTLVSVCTSITSKNVNSNKLIFGYLFNYTNNTNPQSSYFPSTTIGLTEPHEIAYLKNITGIVDNDTLNLLSLFRCGLLDKDVKQKMFRSRTRRFSSRFFGKRTSLHITWGFNASTAIAYNFLPGTVRMVLHKAFDTWSRISLLTFTEVQYSAANLKISFQESDGRGKRLAFVHFLGSDVNKAHIFFDSHEKWYFGTDGVKLHGFERADGATDFKELDTCFFHTAIHEIGHSIGLYHSNNTGSVMLSSFFDCKYEHNINYEITLPMSDILDIQTLYGVKNIDQYKISAINDLPIYEACPVVYAKASTTTSQYPSNDHYSDNEVIQTPKECEMTYDAITTIRQEIFIFKESFVWRLNKVRNNKRNPLKIKNFWKWPEISFDHVDAVCETIDQSSVVFFIGSDYYIYNINENTWSLKKSLHNLLHLTNIRKIDAAMTWVKPISTNTKIYIFSGTKFWRLSAGMHVDDGYPQLISTYWKGIEKNIDAAFQWNSSITYFFKGKHFWEFDNERMIVKSLIPQSSAEYWMNCPSRDGNKKLKLPRNPTGTNKPKGDKSIILEPHPLLTLFITGLIYLLNVYI